MIDIPSISAVIAAFGVIVGVVLTIAELRNLAKQRQTDLVMRLHARVGTREFLDAWEKIRTREFDDYNKYVKKYGLSDIGIVITFFEGIGVLLHRTRARNLLRCCGKELDHIILQSTFSVIANYLLTMMKKSA